MNPIKHHKFVSSLPASLEADSIYYVKDGSSVLVYVTNSTGTIVAYPLAFSETDPVWQSEKADYYERSGGSSKLDTGSFGPVLRPTASGDAITTPWARAYVVENKNASKAVFVGAVGSETDIDYAYFCIDSSGLIGNGQINAFRAYPTFPAWGTSRIYHQGYLPVLNEITAVANGEISNKNIVLSPPTSVGLEVGTRTTLPSQLKAYVGAATGNVPGEINGSLILIPRSNITSPYTTIYSASRNPAFRVHGNELVQIFDLAGTGFGSIRVDSEGKLYRVDEAYGPSNLPPNWSIYAATTNVILGTANYVNADGVSGKGLLFQTDGDVDCFGALNSKLPNFRSQVVKGTHSSGDRKLIEFYASNGDSFINSEVPQIRRYCTVRKITQFDFAGSLGETTYAWEDMSVRKAAGPQTETEAHVGFTVPSGSLLGVEVNGIVKDSSGIPHYFKIAAAVEGGSVTTKNSVEILAGPVTASWYVTSGNKAGLKVVCPSGSNWNEGTVEISKGFDSSLSSISNVVVFRNTNL